MKVENSPLWQQRQKRKWDDVMMDLSRSEILLGKDGVEKLRCASVCIFGVGGVGSFTAEAIARSGVGKITIVDFDTVSPSNINRQIPATEETVGRSKVEVMASRMRLINSAAEIIPIEAFCTAENVDTLLPAKCDFIVDAVDTVSAKIAIILAAKVRNIPVISCMGAGNKLDMTKFQITDIYKTSACPLCRVMRHELRKKGVDKLDVVFSTEQPAKTDTTTIGSLVYVTGTAGLLAASHVIRKLSSV